MPSPSVLQLDLLGVGMGPTVCSAGSVEQAGLRPGLEESLPVTVPLEVCLEVGLLFGLALELDRPRSDLLLPCTTQLQSLGFLIYKMGAIAPSLWLCYDSEQDHLCEALSVCLANSPHSVIEMYSPGAVATARPFAGPAPQRPARLPGVLLWSLPWSCSALALAASPTSLRSLQTPSPALGAPSRSLPLHLN